MLYVVSACCCITGFVHVYCFVAGLYLLYVFVGARDLVDGLPGVPRIERTRHILPPSETDLGLFWADFTDLEGKHLFHRIG